MGEVFVDGVSILDISNSFRGAPKKVKRNVTKGLHEIRIDLENLVHKKIIEKTYTSDGAKDVSKKINVKFKVVASGSARHRRIKCIFTNKTNSNESFIIENTGKNKEVIEVIRQVIPNQKYGVQFVPTADRGTTNVEKKYLIQLAAPGSKGRGKRASIGSVEDKKIKYLDEDGDDPNATLSIKSASPGASANRKVKREIKLKQLILILQRQRNHLY